MLYIRDDLGMLWTFDKENRRVVLVGDMDEPTSGYGCNSWEEAVEILNEGGYITNEVGKWTATPFSSNDENIVLTPVTKDETK